MNKIRILIADDLEKVRSSFKEKVSTFEEQYGLEIIETAYPQAAKDLISVSAEKDIPFDILFIDINFSSVSENGGKVDSGYEIMKHANHHSPVSRIFSYSAHGTDDEISTQYVKLLHKGVFNDRFDKSKYVDSKYFNRAFEKTLVEVKNQKYLPDCAGNHVLIKEEIEQKYNNGELSKNSKDEINSNLDSILMLLKNQNLITAKTLLYRLILQLYQRCLELYCEGNKNEDEIKEESEINRPNAEKILIAAGYLLDPSKNKKAKPWELGERKNSALRKIVAHGEFDKLEFGWLLNKYRNDCVHKDFPADVSNILFANLTLSLYILKNKTDIKINRIDSYCQKTKDTGKNDLQKLLAHINRS